MNELNWELNGQHQPLLAQAANNNGNNNEEAKTISTHEEEGTFGDSQITNQPTTIILETSERTFIFSNFFLETLTVVEDDWRADANRTGAVKFLFKTQTNLCNFLCIFSSILEVTSSKFLHKQHAPHAFK